MSFRHPTATPRRRPRPPLTSTTDGLFSSPSHTSTSRDRSTPRKTLLIDVSRYPRQRRPRNSKHLFIPGPEALLTLPGRTKLTQVYSLDDFNNQSPRRRRPISTNHDDSNVVEPIFDDVFTVPPLDSDTNGRRRKENQWNRWTTDVIPSLLRPYLQLLRETENLRDKPDDHLDICTCGSPGRPASIITVYFDREPPFPVVSYPPDISKGLVLTKVYPCACTSLPVKLLLCGLFPCTPIRPSIAVDISFLQFAREIFLRFGPNTTAMSEALEAFLTLRRYKPETKVGLTA
jgi:hypothetical protein